MNPVSDAIRTVTAKMQKSWDRGGCSAAVDIFDLIEALNAIAEQLDGETIDWRKLTDAEVDQLARHGKTPRIRKQAKATARDRAAIARATAEQVEA